MMHQAIETKFHGPTNSRGSRVSAKASAGRVTLSWNHALNSEDNHRAAARALAEKFKWKGEWVGGGMANDRGYVFVNVRGDFSGFGTGEFA